MSVSIVSLHRRVLRAYTIFSFYAVFTVWRTLSWRFRILRKLLWTKGEWKHVPQKEEVNVINLTREQSNGKLPLNFPIHLCFVLTDSCPFQSMSGAHEPAVRWRKGYSQEKIEIWSKTRTQGCRHTPLSLLFPWWKQQSMHSCSIKEGVPF